MTVLKPIFALCAVAFALHLVAARAAELPSGMAYTTPRLGMAVCTEVALNRFKLAQLNMPVDAQSLVGVVENNAFVPVLPKAGIAPLRLTAIARMEARPPESAEIHLLDMEGQAVLVTGIVDGTWIYRANVIETAGPILSAVVHDLRRRQQEK